MPSPLAPSLAKESATEGCLLRKRGQGSLTNSPVLTSHLALCTYEDTFSLKVKKQGEQRVLLQDVVSSVKGRKILVVHDMFETGKGLKLVKEHFESRGAKVMTASLYVLSTADIRPDWYMKEVEEAVVFTPPMQRK